MYMAQLCDIVTECMCFQMVQCQQTVLLVAQAWQEGPWVNRPSLGRLGCLSEGPCVISSPGHVMPVCDWLNFNGAGAGRGAKNAVPL